MDWLHKHKKETARLEKEQRAYNKEIILKALKKKHHEELKEEIEKCKKKLEQLEIEIQSYI